MLNLGQLAKFITMVPPKIGEKIKEAMTTYVNGDEMRARTKLRTVIPDLEKLGGYDEVVEYLKRNAFPIDGS